MMSEDATSAPRGESASPRAWYRSPWFTLPIRLAVTFGLIALVFTRVPLSRLVEVLAEADFLYCALAYAAIVLMNVAGALQLVVAVGVHDMPFSVWQIIRLQFIAVFYSVILPSELTTSVIKWARLSKGKAYRAQSAAILILCRLINYSTLLALGLAAAFFDEHIKSPTLKVLILLAFIGCILATLPLFSRRAAEWAAMLMEPLTKRFPLPAKLKAMGGKVWQASTAFSEMGAKTSLALVGWAVAQQILGAWAYWMLFKAVDVHLSIASILWLRVVLFIINALPISFNGLGVREATLTSILPSFYGVSAAGALAGSLTLLGRQVIMFIIGGLCEIYDGFQRQRTAFGRTETAKE